MGVSVGVLRPLKAFETFQTVLCRLERRVQREGPATRVTCHVTAGTSDRIRTLADDRFTAARDTVTDAGTGRRSGTGMRASVREGSERRHLWYSASALSSLSSFM